MTRSYNTYSSVPTSATPPYQNTPAIMTPPKSLSPNAHCKNVHFRLCSGVSDPKTLHIYPHDTTDSITTTVKNMFGLGREEDSALSFQDPEGRYMILQHENFEDGMTVNIRVEENPHRYSYQIRQSLLDHLVPCTRSVSPSAARGRRSASAGGRPKSLKRSAASHDWENGQDPERYGQDYFHQQFLPEDYDEDQRGRVEPLASAEISLDNIVEGSRRKRPKFSSDVSHTWAFFTCQSANYDTGAATLPNPRFAQTRWFNRFVCQSLTSSW